MLENTNLNKINPHYRLLLTTMPTELFPQIVLKNSLKITCETPDGIKLKMENLYK
ncbi:MAG: hypothetical protein ACK52J_00875 [bacterium]|jgi:hypothetical protein